MTAIVKPHADQEAGVREEMFTSGGEVQAGGVGAMAASDEAATHEAADGLRNRRKRFGEVVSHVGGANESGVDRLKGREIVNREAGFTAEPFVQKPIGVAGGEESEAEELESLGRDADHAFRVHRPKG